MNFRERGKPLEPSFQIAPMIDIAFTLLFFFITTQMFSQWETELDIKLPTARPQVNQQRLPGEIIINVLKDGTIIVNKRVLDKPGLLSVLNKLVEQFPGQPVLVRADKQTPYEHVIGVLDLCCQSDIWNVSFATAVEPVEKAAPASERGS